MIMIPQERRVEQTIKKQVTVNAGTNGAVSIPIPNGVKAYLKGYGYTWYTANTFILSTGNLEFPKRTDQEGSASIPRIFDSAYQIRSGGTVQLRIFNDDSSNHDYDVVFYIITDSLLEGPDYESTGGELLIGTSTGTVGSNVTTLTGSKTQLENIESANNAALADTAKGLLVGGRLKAAPPSVADGDFVILRVNEKGEIIISGLAGGMSDAKHIKGTFSDPASSTVDVNLSATVGAGKVFKGVFVFFPTAGEAAEVSVYDGDPAGAGVLLETYYYNTTNFITCEDDYKFSTGLYLRLGGQSGGTQTGYYTVKYQA